MFIIAQDWLNTFLAQQWLVALLTIALLYLVALVVQRLSRPLAHRLLSLTRLTRRRRPLREERLKTLRDLTTSLITLFAFLVATMLSLIVLNVELDTIIWAVGLFTAGFGLGARPLVSDFLTGVSFLFEDPYDVGEKVELAGNVQGVVEGVYLRTTLLRSHTGELYTVPNGEVRVIRNFSRGRFSVADIKISVGAADLERALPLLDELGHEAVALLPNLLEPWNVLSTTGEMGAQAELTLAAKARFGHAAEMRPRMLTLVQKRLEEAEIALL